MPNCTRPPHFPPHCGCPAGAAPTPTVVSGCHCEPQREHNDLTLPAAYLHQVGCPVADREQQASPRGACSALSPREIAERRCDTLTLEEGQRYLKVFDTARLAAHKGVDTYWMWRAALEGDDSVSVAAQVEAAASVRTAR